MLSEFEALQSKCWVHALVTDDPAAINHILPFTNTVCIVHTESGDNVVVSHYIYRVIIISAAFLQNN